MYELKVLFDLLEDIKMSDIKKDFIRKNIFLPTEIFNERWLIKILLKLIKNGEIHLSSLIGGNDFDYKNLKYFSEADIGQAEPRQHGTKADGLIGHFEFDENKVSRIIPVSNMNCIIIAIEAKLYSDIKKKTENTTDNQIIRYIKCLNKYFKNNYDKYFVFIYPADYRYKKNIKTIIKNINNNEMKCICKTWEEILSLNDYPALKKYYDMCKIFNRKM